MRTDKEKKRNWEMLRLKVKLIALNYNSATRRGKMLQRFSDYKQFSLI